MNSGEWNIIKEELKARGFNVQVKGRNRREYIGFKDFMSVDIFRGGLSGTGSTILLYIFDENQQIVVETESTDYRKILENIDSCIEDYNTFGSLAS